MIAMDVTLALYPIVLVLIAIMYGVIVRFWYKDLRSDNFTRLTAGAIALFWPLSATTIVIAVMMVGDGTGKPGEEKSS